MAERQKGNAGHLTGISCRNLRSDDSVDMHALASDWSVVRQLGSWPWPPQAAFTQSRCRPFAGEGFIWAICRNDRLIGTMGVTGRELGYCLLPAEHGKGIISHAADIAIDHAFAEYGWSELKAGCWYDNRASARVLEKLGFVHWQSRYEHSKARGLPVITYRFRLPRVEWHGLRSAQQ